jgi:hypothetical protein
MTICFVLLWNGANIQWCVYTNFEGKKNDESLSNLAKEKTLIQKGKGGTKKGPRPAKWWQKNNLCPKPFTAQVK